MRVGDLWKLPAAAIAAPSATGRASIRRRPASATAPPARHYPDRRSARRRWTWQQFRAAANAGPEERAQEQDSNGELEEVSSYEPADAEHGCHYAGNRCNRHAATLDPNGASKHPDE